MMDEQKKTREEYLEVFGRNGEIEFTYNGYFYHIEPDYNREDTYEIWKFADKDKGTGEKIAVCSPASSTLDEKTFDGKTILEIDDKMTNCIIR